MLGHVIRRYGPTTMLIVIAVILWAGLEGAGRRLDALQSFNSQRFNSLEGRINNLEQGQAELREWLGRVETKVDGIQDALDEITRGAAVLQGVGGPDEPL